MNNIRRALWGRGPHHWTLDHVGSLAPVALHMYTVQWDHDTKIIIAFRLQLLPVRHTHFSQVCGGSNQDIQN